MSHDAKVLITNSDKVFFAERGETKGDLAEHYLRVAAPLMRAMGGRPVLLQRFPHGAGGPSFFQKRVPKNIPDWLQTTTVSTPNGTMSQALVAADIDHVLWAVNLGCLGFHVWPYLAADPDHTDELRIDLDPSPGVDFTHIRQAAHELHTLLTEVGIAGFPKTTGNRGLHVYVRLQPRWDSYQVRSAAVAIARELQRRRPDLITAAWWKEERGPRISTRTRRTRLSSARGRSGPAPAHRSPLPSAGRRSTRFTRTSSRSRPSRRGSAPPATRGSA
jgi:DNA ligase D-like protein (predicted polymerase)